MNRKWIIEFKKTLLYGSTIHAAENIRKSSSFKSQRWPALIRLSDLVEKRIGRIYMDTSMKKANRALRRTRPSNPPKFGEYLLYFFLSRQNRINLLGDLEEEFKEVQKKFGRLPAKIFYYKQVVCSIGPLIWKKLAKWGVIAAVEEWIRRHI